MRPGLPSGTSLLVSFARGLGVDTHEIDPLASELLPPVLAQLAAAPRHLGGVAGLYRAAVRATTFGLIDHMVLRTQAIDAHLASALQSGIDQLVILGAGLDARAWRLEVLKDVTVFEVDHPATQRYKRTRMSQMRPPGDIRYVSVDFETERFSSILEGAGFRSAAPSAWIWEGVAMYLPLDAVHDTLGQLTSLAAAGSELAMTYRVPGMLPYGSLGRVAIPAVFAAAGEPLKATLQPHELASAVAPDWDVTFDEDSRGWRKLTGSTANASRSFLSERLAIVKRRG
ncbi:MAG: SAM-dependent methyltransferase [Myxococcales bacterium]|nr:SAM-dependent methyltransferase [Myxococcales bacterium]